jgi:GTP-binding protein Era
MKSGFVSLVGRPNAGKSTLLNRLAGTKLAIVSDKPQTTRNRILAVRTSPDAQVIFLDTPGIHRPLHRMNVRMVDAAVATMSEVDVLATVVDVSEPPGAGDRFLMDLVRRAAIPVVLVLNKIDLVPKPTLLPVIDRYSREREFAEIVPVSGLTGDGVDRLEAAFVRYLPEGEPLYPADYLTDQPERFLAAEIIREQILRHLRAELPFATAVLMDQFEEPDERGLLRIVATILVEQASQKPIVVGRGGRMIREIGSGARRELERLFGTRVYLDLRVKVRANWREDPRVLAQIGVPPSGKE